MNGQPEYTQKHANLFLSLQKTNTFTTTAIGKGDTGIVTDFSTGRRSDSVLTEVGRPRRGWSKRTQFLIAFGVVFVVILVICIFLGVFLGKNGSGDSSADNEAAVHSNTDSKTSDGPLVPSSTASTNPTTKPESTPNPALTSSEDLCQLPSETGRCRAHIPSWYYDSKEGRCTTFIYGGCGGNANRFSTKAACEQQCGKDDTATEQSNTATTSNERPKHTSTASTNPTTKPESTSNPAPTSSGDWSSWESWTSCSVTCGSGMHVRYRTCNKTESTEADCEGQYVEQAVCELDDCPVNGKWTTWSQWGGCGATCGGGVRSRSRQCNKVSSTDIDCVGETVQQTTCNEWDCPDCSKPCSAGNLNDACDTCVCESSSIQGRVLSTAGNPVSFADIAAETAPMRVITQSSSTGFFSLNETCISTTVLLTREGFQDKVVEITSTYQTIYMELEVSPRITEHPQPKYRITGEDVSFCCSAVSAPAITYYEWFHNSVLLDESLSSDNGTKLEMTNVQPSDSGEYTCRANNEVRGIYSNAATLNVRDNEDEFCEDALQEKQVKLPEECSQPGRNTTVYEVGDCALKTCRQANSNATEQCRDSLKSCCHPSQIETKTVNCTDYEIELIVVKACSCGSCDTTTSVQISGKVISAQSGSPVEYAEVWLNGELEDWASDTGSFYITVADSIGKAVFTIKDVYRNTYLDTTKVVEISNGVSGTISVTIQMLEMADPVTIDSTAEAVLSLDRSQNDSSSPVALIKVPANAFYRNDGSAYTGMVSSFVTFIDPTDDNVQSAIPGVFQIIDEDGSTIDLESKGMFNLQFQDDAGGDLYVDGLIEVSFPDQAADNFTLWKLNTESGLWESLDPSVQAYSRKRRQAASQVDKLIGEIDTSIVRRRGWINIDKMIRYYTSGQRCYYKSRLYKDETLSEEVLNDNARYRVDYRVVSGQTLVTLYNWFMTDWRLRLTCFVAACNNKVGYISLETYHVIVGGNTYKLLASQPLLTGHNLQYKIMESSVTIGAIMESSTNGPFYKSYSTCQASDINQSHFRFHKASTPDIYTARYFSPGGPPFGENRKIMDTVWYPKRESFHTICLMKVKITFTKSTLSPETSLKFHVFSFGGDHPDVKNFLFGIREYEVDISATTQYTCAEYKCSGNLEQSSKIDFTRVKIALASRSSYSCQVQSISTNIVNYSLNDHLQNPAWLQRVQYAEAYVPDIYGSSWGIYEAHITSKDFVAARNKVNGECLKTSYLQNAGASVHFHCRVP